MRGLEGSGEREWVRSGWKERTVKFIVISAGYYTASVVTLQDLRFSGDM